MPPNCDLEPKVFCNPVPVKKKKGKKGKKKGKKGKEEPAPPEAEPVTGLYDLDLTHSYQRTVAVLLVERAFLAVLRQLSVGVLSLVCRSVVTF